MLEIAAGGQKGFGRRANVVRDALALKGSMSTEGLSARTGRIRGDSLIAGIVRLASEPRPCFTVL
jgi:hypothetical protein